MKRNDGKKEIKLMVEIVEADPDYFDIYKIKLKRGRLPEQSDTVKEYVINETCAKELGFTDPDDAVGNVINRGTKKVPIVGVMADFNSKSTHDPIKPLAYASNREESYHIHLALKAQDGTPGLWKSTLDKVEKEFKTLYPEEEFKYQFFDAEIAAFYKKEQDVSRLLNWSAGLCIFISCLGLLGLVIYTTNTRTKEIGVRKVLGASVVQIVSLLSKDLVSLVLIAFVIASPIAWWAIIILSIRTVKAALTNPVKSLRTE
jgi:hypothetical protein